MGKKFLIIATANEKKFLEIERLIELNSQIWKPVMASKWEKPFLNFPPETGSTFHENAKIKSEALAKECQEWSFGEDSGLVVEALGGKPGVYSARYGGNDFNDQERYEFLLKEMKGIKNRKAYFQTVISLAAPDGKEVITFTGKVFGVIQETPSGQGGFGYDPVFVPDGYKRSMGELSPEEKDSISHRGKAIADFLKYQPNYID